MDKNKLTNNIFEKIESEQLEPKSRASFVVRNGVLWITGVLSVIIGSAAVAVIIYMIDNDDWDLYQEVHGNAVTFLFTALPYFWLVLFMLFIAVAYANIHSTKRGYRFRFRTIVVVVLGVTVVSGSTLYAVGMGEAIDVALSESVPLYSKMLNNRDKRWSHPERGQLGGQIVEIEEQMIIIMDFNNHEWTVVTTNAVLPPFFELEEKHRVRVIGEQTDDMIFTAKRIAPWHRPKSPHWFSPVPELQY